MAIQLAAFPETNYHRYAWETWAEPGTIWQLRRGEDYSIPVADMARRAYTYAENHGLRARLLPPGRLGHQPAAPPVGLQEGRGVPTPAPPSRGVVPPEPERAHSPSQRDVLPGQAGYGESFRVCSCR